MLHKKIDMKRKNSQYQAELYTYLLDNSPEMKPDRKRPLVLLCPGGGYGMTSDREAEPLAMQFLARGIHAAILRYSVAPARYPEALLQLAAAVALLRENAETWHIDPEKIVVQGSSAGGHLAASLGVLWEEKFLSEELCVPTERLRPNGLLLCYPVITSGEKAHRGSFENLLGERHTDPQLLEKLSLEKQVTARTPKTFLWHTATDDIVPVENSLLFFEALCKNQVPAELHIYPVGGHGLGLANEETSNQEGYGVQEECQSWMSLACDWLRHI